MANYKGVSIPDTLHGLIQHMHEIEEARDEITELNRQWELLTILSQMSDSGMEMGSTRESFHKLTEKLLGELGLETLAATVQRLTGLAQVSIDILVRNLFERTADIGFLATDDEIREALTSASKGQAPPSWGPMQIKFREYVAKYSVYDNVILLTPEGRVTCALNSEGLPQKTNDPVVGESISTTAAYVEKFYHTDLVPGPSPGLIYAYRIHASAEKGSPVVGVLVLVFKLQDELQRIFKNLVRENDWTLISIVNSSGQVIGSSAPHQLPVGSQVSSDPHLPYQVIRCLGRLYLAKLASTKGYQGYMGPGWMGLAMVPLEYAFMSDQGKILELKPELLVAISENRELFSESIREIPKEAERIQAQLDRTVWNGNLLNSGQQATTGSFGRKVLLWEISSSGNKTRKVFEKSIGQLMGKAVSSILNSAAAHSALAVDIMDRNLYERANDCRWWSLAKVFREVFERGSLSEQEISECNRVLSYINGLYTVYTNLFLFDVNGRIVAVSNPSEKHQLGKILSDDYIRACLSNGDSQSYSVSPFVSTDLYGGRPTYIYASSIISEPDGEGVSKVLGGIGIVFDSEPQFRAMLQDSLPKGSNGQIKTGHIALFVNAQRQVISCSDSSFSPGQILDLPIHLEDIKHGESKTELCEIKGEHFAVGVTLSHGYREYKGESDSYKNDIYGIVMSSLGKAVALAKSSNQETRVRLDYGPKPAGLVSREFATFTIAGAWLGVDKEKVVECIDLGSITPVPGMPKAVMGTLLYKGDPVFVIEAYDLLSGSEAKAISDRGDQVVILKISGELVGLRVDDLGEIPEVPESYIVSAGQWSGVNSQAVQALVKPAPNDPLKRILVILNLEKFLELTIGNQKMETVRAPLSGEIIEISENKTGSLKSAG